MAVYVKWNCSDIWSGTAELLEALTRLSPLTMQLRSIRQQLDPDLSGYDGLGRSLQTLSEGLEENARRLRNECNALEGVIAVYVGAERATLIASESLPAELAKSRLVFEGWFADLLR